METRSATRLGRAVSAVGLGTRGLATRTGASEGQRAIGAAIDAGCTLVEVAPGWADSQVLVGQTVRDLRARDRVVVASLVEPLAPPPARPSAGLIVVPAGSTPDLAAVLPAAYVQRAVEDSLRALRLDAIPLALLNRWHDAWLGDRAWPELRGTLERLVREGKVMAWGVAARGGAADDAVLACAEPWVAAVQVRRSMFDRSADAQLLPAARAAGAAVLVREPLAGGALTGELAPDAPLPTRDERSGWSPRLTAIAVDLARRARWTTSTPPGATATAEARAIIQAPRRGADLAQATLTELAMRYAIDPPAVTAAVVGARTIAHAVADLAYADGRRLAPDLVAALDEHSWGAAWYASP